jgi:hypothetical protein
MPCTVSTVTLEIGLDPLRKVTHQPSIACGDNDWRSCDRGRRSSPGSDATVVDVAALMTPR